jgi:hypothetical protein
MAGSRQMIAVITTFRNLYNKPTQCTIYLHFIELPHLYMFRAHHQEVECIYVTDGTCFASKSSVSGPGWK